MTSADDTHRSCLPDDMIKTPDASFLRSIILSSLSDSKAEDISSIDLSGKGDFAEYMIICSGRSHRHVGSISESLRRVLKPLFSDGIRIEGSLHCDWVLVDAGDIIVHIFRPEVREFYNLEKLWSVDSSSLVAI